MLAGIIFHQPFKRSSRKQRTIATTKKRTVNQAMHCIESVDDFMVGRGADISDPPPFQTTTNGTKASRRQKRQRPLHTVEVKADAATASNEYVLNIAFFSFLGFLLVQVVFALIARSQAMLADSAAMMVDAFTYLFNLIAERIKKRPMPVDDSVPDIVRKRQRRRKVLYLEIVPPLISVVTLIVVSVVVLADAVDTILKRLTTEDQNGVDNDDDLPNAWIMFLFSSANLALDVMNVTCFAKAKSFGFFMLHHLFGNEQETDAEWNDNEEEGMKKATSHGIEMEEPTIPTESTRLVGEKVGGGDYDASMDVEQIDNKYFDDGGEERTANLNMCSAYTHVVADTLRSLAVVVAASLATIFGCIPSDVADATGAIVVSFIIAISLGPLLAGLFDAWSELSKLNAEERKENHLLETLMRESSVDLQGIDL